jgi:hypothetical protein
MGGVRAGPGTEKNFTAYRPDVSASGDGGGA